MSQACSASTNSAPVFKRRNVGARDCSRMKFRFVMLEPDEDPEGNPPTQKCEAALSHSLSRTLRYERRGVDMVRVERLGNGRSRSTPVANFTARIVTDIIRDDGEEQSRDFGVEAEVDGCRLTFTVPAAEFG